jgi:aminoglycoside phosphotransferase (APT) family kinase protein
VGVPAPEVVGVELDLLPIPFLLMRRIPGAPPESATDPVFVEAGRLLRLTHSLSAPGFGYLAENGHGPYKTWTEFTAEPVAGLDDMVEHDLLSRDVAQRLRSCVDRYRDAVAYDGPPVLLHGDLHPRHVFTADGRLTGIIDWGDVAGGDPRLDLSRFSKGAAEALPALLEGYGLELTPELSVTMIVYRLLWTTMVLREEFRAGGDWFDAYRSAIVEDLTLLP